MVETVVGLDLAATLQKPKVGIAVLRKEGNSFALDSLPRTVTWTEEILAVLDREGAESPVLLAIDAPIKLPFNVLSGKVSLEAKVRKMEDQAGTPGGWDMVYTYRPLEYLVFERMKEYGVSGRPFSSLAITYRSQVLKQLLEDRGWELVCSPDRLEVGGRFFTEVFPNLAMSIVDKGYRTLSGSDRGKRIHDERLSRKRTFVQRLFKEGCNGVSLVDRAGFQVERAGEDLLDAVIRGWTGALMVESRAFCLGDEEYGFVICPEDTGFVDDLAKAVRSLPFIKSDEDLARFWRKAFPSIPCGPAGS